MRLQNRRVLGATVSALGAALVLAGCGAGQITQTDTQQPAVNGTYAQVKTVLLRNAVVQYPAQGPAYSAGQSAPLSLTIANDGPHDDQLVSVTSTAAQSPAKISGSRDVVAGHTLVIGPSAAVESTNEQAPPSSSGAPASSTAAGTSNQVGTGTVVLPDLKQPLWPGTNITVTFTFRDAGPITVEMPVAAPAHVEP